MTGNTKITTASNLRRSTRTTKTPTTYTPAENPVRNTQLSENRKRYRRNNPYKRASRRKTTHASPTAHTNQWDPSLDDAYKDPTPIYTMPTADPNSVNTTSTRKTYPKPNQVPPRANSSTHNRQLDLLATLVAAKTARRDHRQTANFDDTSSDDSDANTDNAGSITIPKQIQPVSRQLRKK